MNNPGILVFKKAKSTHVHSQPHRRLVSQNDVPSHQAKQNLISQQMQSHAALNTSAQHQTGSHVCLGDLAVQGKTMEAPAKSQFDSMTLQ